MKNKYQISSLSVVLSIVLPIVLLSLLLVPFTTGCGGSGTPGGKKSGGGQKALMFPVETTVVKNRAVTYSIYAVGSVEAFETVLVTARVAGVVDKVLFSEGARVQADQVLVEIEPERYRLVVESARAARDKAEAARDEAEAGLERRRQVVEKNPGLIPGEELETWRTRVLTATSEVTLAQAQLNQAELNLHDALVRSPVPGIIQTRTVQTGQYVEPGSVLATMVRRDPLLLRFKVPEQDAHRLTPGLTALFTVKNDETAYSSVITHVAASADENTRMAAITAEVNDKEKDRLRPGAFAEIRVPVGSEANMPVIPQTSIRPGERGFIAYVVEGEKAKERILTLGMRTSDGFVEVLDGLKEGETLVVRGAEALQDGVPVRITRGSDIITAVDPGGEKTESKSETKGTAEQGDGK
jgi:multidrug efflux system membrane fusion protein